MDTFDHRLWDSQGKIPALPARVSFSDYENSWLIFEKIANLVVAQIPNFGNFPDSIVPFDWGRLLDL